MLCSVFLAFLGAVVFLRIVGQALENQRRRLEHGKSLAEEAKRREEMSLLVAETVKIDT